MDHGFSTRKGGWSRGVYSQLNLGFFCGDEAETVALNRKLFFHLFHVKPEQVFTVRQVHGDRVLVVDRLEDADLWEDPVKLPEADGLIIARSGTAVATVHADCVPIILVDVEKRVVAAVHAGWRGTLRGIARVAVGEMQKAFNSKPADLVAAIGPSIGECCFEVLPELYKKFREKFTEFSGFGAPQPQKTVCLDLPLLNKEVLVQSGLSPQRVDVSGLCTSCRPEEFFSYRREGGETGRHLSLAFLK